MRGIRDGDMERCCARVSAVLCAYAVAIIFWTVIGGLVPVALQLVAVAVVIVVVVGRLARTSWRLIRDAAAGVAWEGATSN